MVFGRFLGALIGVLAMASCGAPEPLPGMQAGETGRVVRVIDGDALALNTGQSVRLVGMEAPALRPRGRDPDAYAVEASRALEDMVMGREVRLYYPGLTRDRYDRALAHVMTIDGAGPELWLNMELVRRGAARVRLYPDTAARGEELLAAEKLARNDKTGLWAKAAYRVRGVEKLPADWRGFTLVTAVLGQREVATGRYAYNQTCQRQLQGTALILEVRKDAAPVCDIAVGTHVRLRGWVAQGRMDLTHALHVEPLEGQIRP